MPGKNLGDSAICLENSSIEEDDISGARSSITGESNVYIGQGDEFSKLTNRKLKQEKVFQRRFIKPLLFFNISQIFPG